MCKHCLYFRAWTTLTRCMMAVKIKGDFTQMNVTTQPSFLISPWKIPTLLKMLKQRPFSSLDSSLGQIKNQVFAIKEKLFSPKKIITLLGGQRCVVNNRVAPAVSDPKSCTIPSYTWDLWQWYSVGVCVVVQTSLVIWIKLITHDNTFKNNFPLQGFLRTQTKP